MSFFYNAVCITLITLFCFTAECYDAVSLFFILITLICYTAECYDAAYIILIT